MAMIAQSDAPHTSRLHVGVAGALVVASLAVGVVIGRVAPVHAPLEAKVQIATVAPKSDLDRTRVRVHRKMNQILAGTARDVSSNADRSDDV